MVPVLFHTGLMSASPVTTAETSANGETRARAALACAGSHQRRADGAGLANGADEVAGAELAQDVDRTDALVDHGHGLFELGDHAAGDDAVGDGRARFGAREAGEAGRGVVDVAQH